MSAPAVLSAREQEQHRVVLTPHPLQRVGAFALPFLGKVPSLDELTVDACQLAVREMAAHLKITASVDTAKDLRGFWLGASYALWPNSAMNTTNRKSLAPVERRQRIDQWRQCPAEAQWPDAPCALCGRQACGIFGKVDVPLGASTAHRNTTAPGQEGLALCFACLTCFHALPYGCAFGGGRVLALHSWDDALLRRFVHDHARLVLRRASLPFGAGPRTAFAAEVRALRVLRSHPRWLRAGVELIVFSNSNKEQVYEAHALEQPLAEWLRTTLADRHRTAGWRYLTRAHRAEKVVGTALLARRAFRAPDEVATRAVAYLRNRLGDVPLIPGEAPVLAPLCFSYVQEVLGINDRDLEEIRGLAARVAEALDQEVAKGTLSGYVVAHRSPAELQSWLKRTAVRWAAWSGARSRAFVTTDQWTLLFDSDQRSRLHRDLLFVAVLEHLTARGWKTDDPEVRAALEDTVVDESEDEA